MARLPRPTKDYDPLAMARELKNAASDGSRQPSSTHQVPINQPSSSRQATDYRRSLFESLFT